MNQQQDFRNFAINHLGVNSNALHQYANCVSTAAAPLLSAPKADYMNPYILEEREYESR